VGDAGVVISGLILGCERRLIRLVANFTQQMLSKRGAEALNIHLTLGVC
jgi:hypothetical protein